MGLIFSEFVSQVKTFKYQTAWFRLEIMFINSGQVPFSAIDFTPPIKRSVKLALLIMEQKTQKGTRGEEADELMNFSIFSSCLGFEI